MKNPLGKTELLGLILLAAIIVAITGCGFLLKGCQGSVQEHPAEVEIIVLDTVAAPASTSTAVKKTSDQKEKQKKSRRKKSAAKKSKSIPAPARDPFRDTIPKL